ncbi:MAG: HDOD domain-containing protein [Burkholderiales bacterium]|nr:HDOD domain-containing protein [Burkholderiales bacterium]
MSANNSKFKLPVLSGNLVDLIHMLSGEDINLPDLSKHLTLDPVLTGRLLKVANSPFFGMQRRICGVDEAIMVLGIANTRGIILSALLVENFKLNTLDPVTLNSYWRHSVGAATAARVISAETSLSPVLAFTAGLMHDIGRLVLMIQDPERYQELLLQAVVRGVRTHELEREVLGTDHCEVGRMVVEDWRLPKDVVQAIALHHDYEQTENLLASILSVADRYASAMELDNPERIDEIPEGLLEKTHLSRAKLKSWFEPTQRRVTMLVEMVQLS